MREEPEVKQLGAFLDQFNRESDRGAALAAGALLDERLEDILRAFMAKVPAAEELLAGFSAPFGTFAAKLSAAHALGLIQDNEFREVTNIRKIRNEFGHSWGDVSFKTQKIVDLANQLPWGGPAELEATSTPRSRFNFAVVMLLVDLLWRARLVERERRVVKPWPNKARGG